MPIKNQRPEITGEYPELAQMVRQITGDVPRMTAANHAGVSHDTIARLWRGERTSEAILIRFAMGYKTDPNPLLEAGGFAPLPETGRPPADHVADNTDEITYITDDERELIRYYRGAPVQLRPNIKKSAKSAADYARELDQLSRIGHRPDLEENPVQKETFEPE